MEIKSACKCIILPLKANTSTVENGITEKVPYSGLLIFFRLSCAKAGPLENPKNLTNCFKCNIFAWLAYFLMKYG